MPIRKSHHYKRTNEYRIQLVQVHSQTYGCNNTAVDRARILSFSARLFDEISTTFQLIV